MPTCNAESLSRLSWPSNESIHAGSNSSGSGLGSPISPVSISPGTTSPDHTLRKRRIRRHSSLGSVIREPFVIQSDLRDSRSQSPVHSEPPEPEENWTYLSALFGWYPCFLVRVFQTVLVALLPKTWKQILFAWPMLWLSAWLWFLTQLIQLPLTVIKFFLSIIVSPKVPKNQKKRTVLISGGSTIQALHLARNFYSAGARVVVCEVEGLFALAKFSTAVSKFYTVPKPTSDQLQNYVRALCEIVDKEAAVYYIPVCATTSAYYDAVAKPHLELLGCSCFCPGIKEVWVLDDTLEVLKRCEKYQFVTPNFYVVNSKADVIRLYDTGTIRLGTYVMTPTGPSGLRDRTEVVLPLSKNDLKLTQEINDHRPWVIVQDLEGEHYLTCTTVKESHVVANVTCRFDKESNGLIPVENKEINLWLSNFFTKLQLLRPITGHVSFRFVIHNTTVKPLSSRVGVSLPYICYTNVHPRLVWRPCKHFNRQNSGPLVNSNGTYRITDTVLHTIKNPSIETVTRLIGTVLDKREALFTLWDPLPYCAYYHMQLPFKHMLDFMQNKQDIVRAGNNNHGEGEMEAWMRRLPAGWRGPVYWQSSEDKVVPLPPPPPVLDMKKAPVKKVEQSKMERRRPPIYRPKSRTESSTPSSTRATDSGVSRGGYHGDGAGGGGMSSDEDLGLTSDLKRRLQEEAALYRRRLDTYKQAQLNQAQLVSRLQAKVLQYKQRCSELEAQMSEVGDQPSSVKPTYTSLPPTIASTSQPSSALEQAQMHLREAREERITNLETALQRLHEERSKSEKLMQFNKTLREQLEESHSTNEMLTADLQKLTNDWEALREEMLLKEEEWKDEEQAFNEYYSTEHNRLLTLWRDVVDVKRLFVDIKSSTDRDLHQIKTDISGMSRDMLMACSRVDTNVFTENLIGVKPTADKKYDTIALESEIKSLKAQRDSLEAELNLKEDKMQQLLGDMQQLEERCADLDQTTDQTIKMQEEIEILQNALRDIAHALIQDADIKNAEIDQSAHVHLSASTPIPSRRSPKPTKGIISTAAFAESTISAVQAALHKYQSYIHELQVKLQTNKEQLLLVRKQLESSEESVAALEKRSRDLVTQLDQCRTQCSQMAQDRESLQKTLDSIKSEKNQLDRIKLDQNVFIEALQQDQEKIQKLNHKLQKEVDGLLQDKSFLQSEIDRLNQEADLREITLRGEEDRCSRIREELLTVREELNRLYLTNDMLEQQKHEAETVISNLEKIKMDYELRLDKILNESSNVQDSLIKKQNVADNLENDKKKLLEDLKKLEEEKIALQSQSNDQQNDIQSLRKELLQAEQQRLDLESDKMSLSEKCKFLEMEKEKIEVDLSQVIRERNDLSNQLTALGRKRDALSEEVMRCKQKLEQYNETNARVNRNLEELVKECEEKQCTIDAMEKEIQKVQELLAATRSEKEALEAVLFDAQTNLEATEDKKNQLDKEKQELLVKQEQLKSQIAKLTKDLERSEKKCSETKMSLTQHAGNKETEFKQTIDKLKQQNEENVFKLTEEREKIRSALEKRLQQSLHDLNNEKNSEIQQLLDKIDGLQHHIDNLCQQHEELLLRAENDKQQALLIAHHDHQALHDRYETTRRELEEEREILERLKRDANSRFDQDRICINQLKDELNKFKARLEETKIRNEEEISGLQHRIEGLRVERDSSQNEVENLKVQLNLCEDKSESLNNLLQETIRKLKEAENNSECLRKELTDVRRTLADTNCEKEKYHATNKELRDQVKRSESEKRDQARQLDEAYQKMTNLEEIKVSLENERMRLQNQIRDLEKEVMMNEHKAQSIQQELQKAQAQGSQQEAEEKELQARLLNEVEERERTHQELHQIRKQMSELERNLEQTRQELNKCRSNSAQMEEQWHAREQDLLVHLEDSRSKEKRLEDQKHNLEVCLVDATQQIQEIKAKLGGAEGRVRALEAQLSQLESTKRDAEQKLFSVVSTLKRIAGIQLDGSVSVSGRMLSPSRRWSPARGHDDGKDGITNVDPEVIRKGVRNLMHQVAQIERERDDYKMQVSNVKKQLQETQSTQNKGDQKLNKVLQSLKLIQEERSNLEAKLEQKHIEFQSQKDALIKRTAEVTQMREKLVSLELNLSGGNEQKLQLEDKVEKLKAALHRSEVEKRGLQEEMSRIENRSTKLELQKMALEGDLQRLQMMLQEKDANMQKIQEKCETQSRTIASLEERCVSLKSTIDQMNCSLEKASENETEMKSEIQRLQRSLMEKTQSYQSESEKLKQMQKSLSSCESERRLLLEKIEKSNQNLTELKRNNQILQDQVSRLNNELANIEVQKSSLESQLRMAQWPSDNQTTHHQEEELRMQLHVMQRERNELKGKVDSMNNKLRQLEVENRNLERLASKSKSAKLSFDLPEKYESDLSTSESDKYDQENKELRMKISRLEHELAEKDAELARIRSQKPSLDSKFDRAEIERYRSAQLQAERLLEAREQSHRQQIIRLENQVKMLREQLNEEIKRRQQYVLRSTKAGREMQQLRQALGDSLRTVSQDPSLDALLLEHEARKLDSTLTATASLPPSLALPSSSTYRRSMTPQPK